MSDHQRYDHSKVVARTDAGAVAIEVMDLNADDVVAWRDSAIRQVNRLLRDLTDESRQLRQIEHRMKKEKDPVILGKLRIAHTVRSETISLLRQDLDRLAIQA